MTYIHDARIENFTSRTWIEIEKGIRKKKKKKKLWREDHLMLVHVHENLINEDVLRLDHAFLFPCNVILHDPKYYQTTAFTLN